MVNRPVHLKRAGLKGRNAFSLVEVVSALIILALISSSVLVVIDRSTASAAEARAKMRAFEVARDNMESILASGKVQETAQYGTSDKHPEVEWQTTIEAFYGPGGERMWVRAICSAQYIDSSGERQSVELTDWLTRLSEEDTQKILERRDKESAGDKLPFDVNDPNLLPSGRRDPNNPLSFL
jgi:type II secretory pathway pseudopilin PulG